MKLTNNFVQSRMNQDLDERLLPKGQYPSAENIRVASSDASDAGAIENVKGNEALTSLNLVNGKTIGVFTDGSNQKIYWFVTSDLKDLVMEYDRVNSVTSVLLESSKPYGVLNFNRDYLITGVNKVVNGDYKRDLLAWTDDLNPIRLINIERCKTYLVDGFDDDDISLMKKPPRFSPNATLTYIGSQIENSIEDSFFQFSYRYKYLDGEYSAMSSFSNTKFSPEDFKLNYQTMENEGMVNSFNAVDIEFNTGGKNVSDIQLLLKETNSNGVAVIETFNKNNESWGDNEDRSFLFSNSKKYLFLPEKELYRSFDNIPKVAKAMELINNRLVFGNYTEGYDLINVLGQGVVIDYNLTLGSKSLLSDKLDVVLTSSSTTNDVLNVTFLDGAVKKGSRISFEFNLRESTYSGTYQSTFSFITNKDYASILDLSTDSEFLYFLEEVVTADFINNYSNTPPADSTILSNTTFAVLSVVGSTMSIKAPSITYRIDNTPANLLDSDFTDVITKWFYNIASNVYFRSVAVSSSIKTNRSYEVGIVYLDSSSRATTVLTSKGNTIRVPQELSTSQNKFIVELKHLPPAYADRFKLVVKQNKAEYQTIYTNIFYEDGLFRWVKLEGANKDKVNEGDTLIVKSDLGGATSEPIKVRVLEVTLKDKDFIEGNQNADGDDIIEEAGLYMKIRPVGFDMNFRSATARTFEGYSHLRYPTNTYTNPRFGEGSVAGGDFVPYPVNAGSSIRVFIEFEARGAIAYKETYDKSFKAVSDHPSIQDWFNAEVVDLGTFGDDFTRGYGFSTGGEQFYVRAHRDGTASRNISTTVSFEVLFSDGIVIFETEPQDIENNIFYETEQTFEVIGGYHQGNIQNQSSTESSAIIEMDFFNCFAQGNGAESYRYKDAFNKKYLNIDTRPTSTSVEGYKEVRRFSDLTYGETYNENTNLNGLNVFNLSTANYKEDIDKKYGSIQKIYARDTDLVVFQEDKVTKVLYDKDMLTSADGSSSLTAVEYVLGRQIPYSGEYGISKNPESFAFDANSLYFTDAKRGCVCKLDLNGIVEISMLGMTNYFRSSYRDNLSTSKLGAYDPYYDQYVLHSSSEEPIIMGVLDCIGVVTKNSFSGKMVIDMDFGLDMGEVGINYSSVNGKPVKYDIEYNGVVYSTGFVGDSIYNVDLAAMGLPNISGSGTGSLMFTKLFSVPSKAKITIVAPLCETGFSLSGSCINTEPLNVVSIILGDSGDVGLTMKSRYNWYNNSYTSEFKVYDSVFNADEVNLYELVTGKEGKGAIPLAGSTIDIQSSKGYLNTADFLSGNKIGYWLTSNLYTEESYNDVLTYATFPTPTETVDSLGNVVNKVVFPFNRSIGQNYLYLIWDYRNEEVSITVDTKIRIYFDSSGSMNTTLSPLQLMKDTILKDRLLPLYNNDSALYDSSVSVLEYSPERTLDMLNLQGDTPEGNVIVLVFQDEANSIYHGGGITPRTANYNADLLALRARLDLFEPNYYRGVVFQVNGDPVFKSLIQAIQTGSGDYAGVNGLSDRLEFNYKYDITDGGTPQYYLDKVVESLIELGYEL